MWATKLTFRIIQFVLAIALIGCGGSMLTSGVWEAWAILVVGPQAVVSAIWSLAEGICILARDGRRGIHPGANVALDLLLWLGFVAGSVVLGITGITVIYSYSYLDYLYYDGPTGGTGLGQALLGLAATLT